MNMITSECLSEGWALERAIRSTLYNSSRALDTETCMDFLDHCAPEFDYKITAYSPEIRRDMVWLHKDREGMQELLETLSKHNRDRTPIVRHWALQLICPMPDLNVIDIVSSLQVYRTAVDGGVSELYAVGRYLDRMIISRERVLFRSREVRLETRMLGLGYHIPF
jgi:methanesulfonate monooxygenase small subunit